MMSHRSFAAGLVALSCACGPASGEAVTPAPTVSVSEIVAVPGTSGATSSTPKRTGTKLPPAELVRIGMSAQRVPRINMAAKVAPQLCMAPVAPMQVSAADPEAEHSGKIFYLRTPDAERYEKIADGNLKAPSNDFFVIKEAFSVGAGGGQGPSAGLFVAWREANQWRFGTVGPDGVASIEGENVCADCHKARTTTGLFGPDGK